MGHRNTSSGIYLYEEYETAYHVQSNICMKDMKLHIMYKAISIKRHPINY